MSFNTSESSTLKGKAHATDGGLNYESSQE